MLKRHKNLIFKNLQTSCKPYKLDFNDFSTTFYENFEHYDMKYVHNSDYKFIVSCGEVYTHLTFSPGQNRLTTNMELSDLESTFYYIGEWIAALAYELNEPDLWEEFAKSQSTNVLDATNNEPLTDAEQTKALKAIEDVKARILSLEDSSQDAKEELKAHIDSHFAHLEEAVNRVGKKDYVLMFQATVFNTITNWMLSPDSRSAIWLFAMEQIRILLIPDIPILPN